ncbi:hypothetical protein [Mycolicibacterium obuense]|uniref:hypothetical protein n=1 Tax=Mycolicibacterium obuense TaxID=1807 RepID=UPI001F398F89|nr:hypothetical protein [Mycolicibacterium obuense]
MITVVATLFVTKGDSRPATPNASTSPSSSLIASEFASANDRGPANIITEDPTCAAWGPINDTLSAEQHKGWDTRNPAISSSDWSLEQRTQYEKVARNMRSAADQTVALMKRTPHRVMRELYAQTIAYWRAYSESVDTYRPEDDHLALTANSLSGSIVWICAAIDFGASAARTPLVASGAPPQHFEATGDASSPTRFISGSPPFCADWRQMTDDFSADIRDWVERTDPNIASPQWSPEQRDLYTQVRSVMEENADQMQQLGLQSDDPVVSDFAALSAQYRRGFVQAIPTYSPQDTYLANTASDLQAAVDQACQAGTV